MSDKGPVRVRSQDKILILTHGFGLHLDVLSDFCKSEPGTNNHNLLSMELSNICLHNVMFRFLDSQLSALSRSSGNLEDLEIRISAAQRHMYDGYQVYCWICTMTSIEFNSC